MNDLSHPSCNAPNWDNPLSTGSWESCAEAGVKRAGAVVVDMREKAAEVVDDKYLMRRQSSCPHTKLPPRVFVMDVNALVDFILAFSFVYDIEGYSFTL
jgi:hypothetical protein